MVGPVAVERGRRRCTSSTRAVDGRCVISIRYSSDHLVGLRDDRLPASSGRSARAAARLTISLRLRRSRRTGSRPATRRASRGPRRRPPRVRCRSSRARRRHRAACVAWLLWKANTGTRARCATCAMFGNAAAVRLPGIWQIASTCAETSASAASPTSLARVGRDRLQLEAGGARPPSHHVAAARPCSLRPARRRCRARGRSACTPRISGII